MPPLTAGRILSRYKRFLADVELENGEVVVAHCPNTGAMTGCWAPGAAVELSASTNPKRKLNWTLERVDMGQGWIGVNTTRTNHIIAELIRNKEIPGLTQYDLLQSEPVYSAPDFPRSRFDFLLRGVAGADCYVEVKNATLLVAGQIQFPDAVTQRGRKHLLLLLDAVQRGYRGVILYAINRPEGQIFTCARQIDPAYADTFRQAIDGGVEALGVRIQHTATGVGMGGLVDIVI